MRLGMVTGKDVDFCDGFIFCVNTVSWGVGKSPASHGTLVLGQQKPVTMSMRKSFSVAGLQFLCVLCGCCHICSRKKKKRRGNAFSPEIKAAILGVCAYGLKIFVIHNSTQPLLILLGTLSP